MGDTAPAGAAVGVTGGVTVRDRRARIAASGAFAVQGLCFAAVLSQVPTLRDKFALDETQLTIVLAAVPIVAGVGSVLAGSLTSRLGSGPVLRTAALGVSLAMAAIGLAPTLGILYAVVAAFGLAVGAVDATMNMQGVAVQRRYGRSIMQSCHAWWSVAGIGSALAAVGAGQLDVPLEVFLGALAAVGAIVALAIGPGLLKREEETADLTVEHGEAGYRIPWGPVVLVGLAVMVMFIGDSATTSWSTIFMTDVLGATGGLVPAALFGYLTCQLLGRTVADRFIVRAGAMATMIAGALLGAAGFAIVATAQNSLTAIGGFALVGFGLSVVVPLSFSAAGALDPSGSGVAIARVNLFNYAGVVVGAVVIGVVGELVDLRAAFAVPAVLVLLILALAPAFRVAGAGRTRARSMAAR
jgi:MFS family permease